jgi:hypothetical protein
VFHAESESGHIWLERDGFSPLFPPEHEERQRKELPHPMALRLGEETAGDFALRWDMTVHFLGMPSTVWGAGSEDLIANPSISMQRSGSSPDPRRSIQYGTTMMRMRFGVWTSGLIARACRKAKPPKHHRRLKA